MRQAILGGLPQYKRGGRIEPTEAQKEAGNYKKDHLSFQGLPITIENPNGSMRTGIDKGGKKWSVKMPYDYGYIKRTKGADVSGLPIDVAFNVRYVLDVLNAVKAEQVVIECSTADKPGVIRLWQREDFVSVIMPMATNLR